MAGINNSGFTPKSFSQIRDSIASKIRSAFGTIDPQTGEVTNMDLSPTSRLGQLTDIVSTEIESVWDAVQATYNSRYPDLASGNNLDQVVSITNTVRRPAQFSLVSCYMMSDNANVAISSNQLVGKNIVGDAEQFSSGVDVNIGEDFIIIYPDDACDEGTVQLKWQGSDLNKITIGFEDDVSTIKAALEDMELVADNNGVNVLGGLNYGYILIEFLDTTLAVKKPEVLDNSLKRYGDDLDCFAYYSSDTAITFTGDSSQGRSIPALSVKEVISSDVNFSACINLEPGVPGVPRETDAQLRIRRKQDLQKVGEVTPSGIKSAVAALPNVRNVFVLQNDTANTDSEGRPAHSFEVYCDSDDDMNDRIAQTIYNSKPIGIGVVSTAGAGAVKEGQALNVNNVFETIPFSRPEGVLVYIHIDLTTVPDFWQADTAEDQIKQNLIAYFEDRYEIVDTGYQRTVYEHSMYTPVNVTIGIADLEIKLSSTLPSDASDANEYTETSIPLPIDKYAYVTTESIFIQVD